MAQVDKTDRLGWENVRQIWSEDEAVHFERVDDNSEKMDLFGRVLCLSRVMDEIQRGYVKYAETMLVTMPAAWTVFDVPDIRPEFAELWASRYGEWDHGGGSTVGHNQLGMAFAWWALHERKTFSEITLADSPDIRARMRRPDKNNAPQRPCTIRGDVGRCTPLALFTGLEQSGHLSFHDLWISVLDWRTQIIVEFHYSPAAYSRYIHFHEDAPDVALRKVFFCEDCGAWTVNEISRERQLAAWRKEREEGIIS